MLGLLIGLVLAGGHAAAGCEVFAGATAELALVWWLGFGFVVEVLFVAVFVAVLVDGHHSGHVFAE